MLDSENRKEITKLKKDNKKIPLIVIIIILVVGSAALYLNINNINCYMQSCFNYEAFNVSPAIKE